MTTKNFELLSIDARRFTKAGERPRTNIRIDHNSSVTLITEVNDKEANVDFRFTANYPGIGVIHIEGRFVYEGEASELVEQWSKTGQMPNNVASEIHTGIMTHCIPEAMILARDVRLPPPIPLPQVNVQGQKTTKGEPQGYV